MELSAWCHLRLGEVLGLERGDVDVLHRWIHIERTSYEVGGRFQLGPPNPKPAAEPSSSPPPHPCRASSAA